MQIDSNHMGEDINAENLFVTLLVGREGTPVLRGNLVEMDFDLEVPRIAYLATGKDAVCPNRGSDKRGYRHVPHGGLGPHVMYMVVSLITLGKCGSSLWHEICDPAHTCCSLANLSPSNDQRNGFSRTFADADATNIRNAIFRPPMPFSASKHGLSGENILGKLSWPALLPGDVSRVLTLDTDAFFVHRSSLAAIWTQFREFENTTFLSASVEPGNGWCTNMKEKGAQKSVRLLFGINSGVLLWDLDVMRASDPRGKMNPLWWWEPVATVATYFPSLADQHAFDILFHLYPQNVRILPCEYNMGQAFLMHFLQFSKFGFVQKAGSTPNVVDNRKRCERDPYVMHFNGWGLDSYISRFSLSSTTQVQVIVNRAARAHESTMNGSRFNTSPDRDSAYTHKCCHANQHRQFLYLESNGVRNMTISDMCNASFSGPIPKALHFTGDELLARTVMDDEAVAPLLLRRHFDGHKFLEKSADAK